MKIKKPLTYDHPLMKEAEEAWSIELESNVKLQSLDDVSLSFYADGFIDGYVQARIKQERSLLWTDYENRFEVLETDGLFRVYDWAHGIVLGGLEFNTEEEAEDYKAEFIEYDKQQENYFNKSGR